MGCKLASQPRVRGFNSCPASSNKVIPLAHEVPIHGLSAGKASGCNSSKLSNPKSRHLQAWKFTATPFEVRKARDRKSLFSFTHSSHNCTFILTYSSIPSKGLKWTTSKYSLYTSLLNIDYNELIVWEKWLSFYRKRFKVSSSKIDKILIDSLHPRLVSIVPHI